MALVHHRRADQGGESGVRHPRLHVDPGEEPWSVEVEVRVVLQFAATGDPGHGAKQWTKEDPWYSKITTSVEQVLLLMIRRRDNQSMVDDGHLQAKDYHLSYHFAAEGGDLTTTRAPPVICLKRFFVEHRVAEVVRRHKGPSPKTLDLDENFNIRYLIAILKFDVIYALLPPWSTTWV